MPRKPIIEQRLSRREAFRLAGAAGAVALVGRQLAGEPGAAQSTTTPACVVTPALTEGPYFVEEKLERADIRTDPMDNTVSAGSPLVLALTVSRVANGTCTPLTGALVDLWHCDARGVYSDEAANNSVGHKFLRGYQVTDKDGGVQFTTIYPGWYPGRAVHIHFKVRLYSGAQQSYEFTSQFFFDESFTDTVYQQAPYNSRSVGRTRNSNDGIYQQLASTGSGKRSGDLLLLPVTRAEKSADGYVSAYHIGLAL
jgi:protocatechuate 3,4-dioxygenase beta subunit